MKSLKAARRTIDRNVVRDAQPDDNFRERHAYLIEHFGIAPQDPQNPELGTYWEPPAQNSQDHIYLDGLLNLQRNFTPRAIQLLLSNWM